MGNELIDGRRHRAMSRTYERLLDRELWAIRNLEKQERALDPSWLLPTNLLERLEAIQEWLVRIPAARERNQRLLEEAESSVPIEQVEAQFRAELIKAMAEWTEGDWALVDAERSKRFPGRWVPAEQERMA